MSYLRDHERTIQMLSKEGFRLALCGHEHSTSALENSRHDIVAFTVGSFGVAWSQLQDRYGGGGDIKGTNQYQLLHFKNLREIQLECRMLDPFKFEDKWIDNGQKSRTKILPTLTGDVSGRPQASVSVSPARKLPSGESIRIAAVRGTQNELCKISQIEFELYCRGELRANQLITEPETPVDFRLQSKESYNLDVKFKDGRGVSWTESFELSPNGN